MYPTVNTLTPTSHTHPDLKNDTFVFRLYYPVFRPLVFQLWKLFSFFFPVQMTQILEFSQTSKYFFFLSFHTILTKFQLLMP